MNKIRINKKILFIISLLLMVCVISFFCVPIKDGRTIFQSIQYNKKVAAAIQPDNYDKMKITSARITERITGTSKFNTSDGNSVDDGSIVSDLEGNDVSSVDNYIRTYDTLTYSVEVSVDRNEHTTTDLDVLTGGVIKVRVTVPKDSETNIPWLVIKKDAWMKDVELSDDFTELTANYQVPTSESLIGGIQELSFRFVAQGYVGEIPANMKPTIEIWMEGNKPDNSSSHYDKKVLTDSEILYSTGKQDYELTLKQGLINRKSSLNGVNGQYLSFGVQLDYKNELRGMEYPYKGINSKIKLEYYYSNPLSGEGWIKLDRNNAEDRRILDGIQLVASGLICEETDNFWPSTSSNKLKGTSSGCYYKGIDQLGSWGDKYPYRYNSGNINATYSNDVLSFNNRNNYFYGYADSGYSHFLVDGFELFIPYYNDGMANYEYQIRLVADELTGYNYQNEPTELNVDSQLSVKLINSVSGNIRAIVERRGCSGCSTSVTPINRYESFYSEISTQEGPYEGGEERLIVWTSSLATLRKESNGEGYYSFEYEPKDGVTTIDNTSISYGIYKNDPVGGIPTNDLTNAALYEDFYWYDTYDEASSIGTISAIHIDSPDYRGYGISSEIQFNLVGRNNKENIGKVGIIRHKINLYKDQDRTIQYSLGYNQNYTPSVINEDGEETNRGTPSTIGHSFVISALDMSLSIIPRSSITGNVQTNFNVQDKYLNIELKPTVTNLIDEEFNSNFRLHIRFGKYLTYREGSANIEPTQIQENGGYNGQALYWNLTDINVSEVPTITFQMEMSPFTPNNYNSGASPDAYLYSPAFPVDDGFDRQPLSFTNLAGSTIRKNVNKDIIEANESFEISDTIYNISDEILQNVKTFEILPKNNDINGSSFHGDYTLKILELAEGQRIFYTTSAINTLGLTQDDDGNLTLRNVTLQNNPQWTEVQINGIIPANATAIGSTISLIDTMSTKGFKYQVIPSNNGYGDKYIFKSLATSDNLTTTIKSDILRVSIVSRNIEGKAYIDLNRNNKYDSRDSLISNHQVKLLNSSHQVVETTTTDNDGKYSFKNLPSGTYYVDFGQKDYYNIIPKGEGNKANSDGLTDLITELSETPTQVEITVSNIDVGYAKKPATLTTKYLIYGTDTNLFDPVTQTVYYTDSYTALPPSDPIPTNYEFYRNDKDPVTGTVTKDEIEVIYYYKLKGATLTTKYLEKGTNDELAPSKVETVYYGNEYQTSPSTDISSNYQFDSNEGDPTSGTVNKDNITVIYYYELKPSTITVHHYAINSTTPVAPDQTINKRYTETYETSDITPTNTNYEYANLHDGDPVSGTVSEPSYEITYFYKLKKGKVITHHYLYNGNATTTKLAPDEEITYDYTQNYTTSTSSEVSSNYEYYDRTSNHSGVVNAPTIEVSYYYKLKSTTLTVKHLEKGTNDVLAPQETETVYYGNTYTTSQSSDVSSNYRFNSNGGDPVTGTVTKDNIEVIYYYELKPSRITVHHYAINSTTPVAPDQIIDKKYTEHYETSPVTPTNPSYEYANSHAGDPVSGTVELDSYEIRYYYKKKTSNITVNYIDEANNPKALQKKETKEYEENVCYPPIEITGYSYLRTTSTITLSEGSCFTAGSPTVTINHIYSINTYKLTVQYVDIDGNIIPNTQPVQTNYNYDAQYTIEKKNIPNYEYDHIQEGYSFTGRMPDHDLTIKVYYHKIPGDLIVNHIIEDKPTQTNTYHKFYGDAYNITPKDIEYYYFDSDASSSLTGTINAPNTVLNLYYKHKKSTITHNYKSSSGATIGDSENETVNYGENINDYIKNPPKTIEGYTYHHNNKSITGNTIETADISIDYIYNLKSSNITIEYYDNNGNEIHDPLTDSKDYFANYSYSPIDIQYYTFKKVDTDYDPASGRVEKDSIKVRFIYERKTATLKVLYVDENYNNIDPDKNRNESKNWGDTYTTEQYDFPNYDFIEMDETSDPPEGKIEKNNVTVIYKYELKPSTITVHHYAINSTTPVAPDQEIHKRYTEHYETSDVTPTNTNYEYANEHDGAPPSGTVSQPSYEITYFYKLKRGTVITHHYLYNGEETTTKLAPDVSKEWNYTDRYTTSISDQVPKNYEFYKKSDNSEDYLQSPQVDVNYYYQLKDSNLESSITITGPEEITDKNKNVDYHIKYEASIVDYIGSGTVVITNTLPYDIDVEKSDLNGGTYNKNNKTITWTHNYSDINSFEEQDDTKKITIEKDISLKYLGIVGRDRSMVSNVRGVITLSNNSRATTNNTTTNIRIKGKIVVKYVDTNGKEVFPSIEKEDLVGESFVSSADEKEGYDIIEKPKSESLEYEEDTQEIKYIYKRKTVKIVTKANTGGNITGDEVVFYGADSTPDKIVIKARDGYVIESVVINGEKVDIKPNQQQLVLGQFKEMKEDYLVEVTFKEKPENPPTSKLTISFISTLVVMFFILLVIKKKKIYRI